MHRGDVAGLTSPLLPCPFPVAALPLPRCCLAPPPSLPFPFPVAACRIALSSLLHTLYSHHTSCFTPHTIPLVSPLILAGNHLPSRFCRVSIHRSDALFSSCSLQDPGGLTLTAQPDCCGSRRTRPYIQAPGLQPCCALVRSTGYDYLFL